MRQKKRVLGVVLAVALAFSLLPVPQAKAASESAATVQNIYVKESTRTYPNERAGTGTEKDPYESLLTALANASDGDNICILGSTYLNTMGSASPTLPDGSGVPGYSKDPTNGSVYNQALPLLIDKAVTIKAADGYSQATLKLRPAGIVLGADVTFENIVLTFEQSYHDAIFANGHHLTLNNVTVPSNSTQVDVFAGSLYAGNDTSIRQVGVYTPGQLVFGDEKVGTTPAITITGSSTKGLGGVYAGSMNHALDKSVTIDLKNLSKGSIQGVYASGAPEQAYRGIDFSLSVVPIPVADPTADPVNGTVTINMESSDFGTTIQGIHGAGSKGTTLNVTGASNRTYVENLDALNVKSNSGFTPYGPVGSQAAVTIEDGGKLALVQSKSYQVKSLSGTGNLILKPTGALELTSGIQKGAQIRLLLEGTTGETVNESSIVLYHPYVTEQTVGGGSLLFTASNTSYTMQSSQGDWYVTDSNGATSTIDYSKLSTFEIVGARVGKIAFSDLNKAGGHYSIPIEATSIQETSGLFDPTYVEFTYQVQKDNDSPDSRTCSLGSDGIMDNLVRFDNLNMTLSAEPIYDDDDNVLFYAIEIRPTTSPNAVVQPIAAGTYYFTFSAPTLDGGSISRTYTLVVYEDETEPTELPAPMTDPDPVVGTKEETEKPVLTSLVLSIEKCDVDSGTKAQTYAYTLTGYDQNGDNITVSSAKWTLTPSNDSKITYTSTDTGATVTVPTDAKSGFYTLSAAVGTVADSVSIEVAEKPVSTGTDQTPEVVVAATATVDQTAISEATTQAKVTAALNDSGTQVTGLEDAALAKLMETVPEAQKADAVIQMSVEFAAKDLTDDTFTLEITPYYSILTESGVAGEKTKLSNEDIDQNSPVTVSVKLPEDFGTAGVQAKLTDASGETETKEVNVKDGYASWEQSSFGKVELVCKSSNTGGTTDDTKTDDTKTDDTTVVTTSRRSRARRTSDMVVTYPVNVNTTASNTTTDETTTSENTTNSTAVDNTANDTTTQITASSTPETQLKSIPFTDVADDAYYRYPVQWAMENGITSGTSATVFSPDSVCTRGQVITFLWKAAGSPAPESASNPFGDVSADSYYYNAVLWAVEQGITSGTSDNAFSPNANVTRGQVVTFLYKAAGSPATGVASFRDIPAGAYYAGAVRWAVAQGITSGTGAYSFGPSDLCTRAQVVTFLYKDATA